jgi:capsular polysaccharide biosynthesis protein
MGFEVVRPEEHSLGEQVSMFSQAEIIVGEAGSALHNALFSSYWTKVVSINYISSVQNSIARLRGHRILYVKPRDGVLRTTVATLATALVSREFSVDIRQVEMKIGVLTLSKAQL